MAALLAPTMDAMQGVSLPNEPEAVAALNEIRSAHEAAEVFLTSRLAETSELLKRSAAARKVVRAYLRRRGQVARIDREG